MKINRCLCFAPMLALGLASCVAPPPRQRAQAPQPAAPMAPPPPVAIAAPPAADWRDAPLSRGDWRYAADGQGSLAVFAAPGETPLLVLRCDLASHAMTLARRGTAPGAVPATLATSSGQRAWSALPRPPADARAEGDLAIRFAASDPQLDAIAFSRGRFAVEMPGVARLVLPAWAELGRVIEDCR
jgi:hypothetical protein